MLPLTLYALPDFLIPCRIPYPPYSGIALYFLISYRSISSFLMHFHLPDSGGNLNHKPSERTSVISFILRKRKMIQSITTTEKTNVAIRTPSLVGLSPHGCPRTSWVYNPVEKGITTEMVAPRRISQSHHCLNFCSSLK